jgi:HSP20 family protein
VASAQNGTDDNKEVRKMTLRPFGGRGFYDPHDEMNRLLAQMLGGTAATARTSGRQQEALTEWAPAIDAVTKDSDMVIRAELPGVKLEDVDITLHNGVLTITGEHKLDEEKERGDYHVRERRYGSFRRSMSLPEGVDESKIHARFEHGVLEITVEGAAIEQAPKRIEIEGSTESRENEIEGSESGETSGS